VLRIRNKSYLPQSEKTLYHLRITCKIPVAHALSYHGQDVSHGDEQVGHARHWYTGTDSKRQGGGDKGHKEDGEEEDKELICSHLKPCTYIVAIVTAILILGSTGKKVWVMWKLNPKKEELKMVQKAIRFIDY